MRELAETARQWAAEGRGGFLARPVTEQGFGPRDPAGAVLIDPRGECVGALYRGGVRRGAPRRGRGDGCRGERAGV